MNSDSARYEETLPGGAPWSAILRRNNRLRITDVEGGGNLALMAYNAAELLERLNLPDTLKAQYTAKLTRGHVLMTDMGRALLSITEDTAGWHDPIGGHGNGALLHQQHGRDRYQEKRNERRRNAHDNFLIELFKHGLSRKDLVGNINFFGRVDVDAEGKLTFHEGNSFAGAVVELRAEMDTLIVATSCSHPLNPANEYLPKPIALTIYPGASAPSDDYCRTSRPENERAFILTERYLALSSARS